MKKQNVKFYLAGAVSLITFAVYLYALQNEFVNWDDDVYVFENPYIRSFDPAFFRWAFSTFYAGNWHPLTWISHALDYAVWGLNPLGHHLTNNILHAVNTFVVVLLVVRLLEAASLLNSPHPPLSLRGGADLRRRSAEAEGGGVIPPGAGDSRFTLIAAAVTGLLFGLHPLHVESVAWVSERKDLLCAMFFLLSVMMYVRYVGRGGSLWLPKEGQPRGVAPTRTYILSLVFFILALLSKPMAVTLPIVLLILDWYPFDRIRSYRTFRTALTGKLPFIALSIMSSAVTILAQKASGAMQLMEVAPLPTRILVAARSLVVYLGKMILPLQLVPGYPYPRDVSLLSPEYLFAVLLIIGTAVISLAFMKRERLWVSVWGYYVVTLIPVLGIVQVGGQAMADRYTYLPSLGPFLVIGLLAAWVYGNTLTQRVFIVRLFSAAAAVILLVSMTYLTISQIGAWKDSIQLWSSVIEKEPARSSFAYYQRATAFGTMGQLDKALEDYNKTIALEPYHYEAYVSRGEVLLRKGYLEEAARDLETAVAIEPSHYQDYNKLGIIYGTSGQSIKAIESFTKSIALNPTNAAGYRNRGYTYAQSGRYDEAREDLTRAIALDQNSAENYLLRGNVYLRTGNKELALSDFQKACEMGEKQGCDALQAFPPSTMNQAR